MVTVKADEHVLILSRRCVPFTFLSHICRGVGLDVTRESTYIRD
jgi:hypothetical protein